MIKRIIQFFYHHADLKLLVLFLVVYLAFPVFLLPMILDNPNLTPLDLKVFYSAETAYSVLASYGEKTRQRYIIGLLTVDLVYPIYYGIFLSVVIVYLLKKQGLTIASVLKKSSLVMFPFLIVCLDFCENMLNVFITANYPDRFLMLASLAGITTSLKWLATLGVIIGIGMLINKTIRNVERFKQ